LPSQAVSIDPATPVSADIERQLNFEQNPKNLVPQSVSLESLKECLGEELSDLLQMAINQGYFTFDVE
jgi:hypothetical protein